MKKAAELANTTLKDDTIASSLKNEVKNALAHAENEFEKNGRLLLE